MAEQKTVAAQAIGYSILCQLDGNRQFTAQCFVSEDESDDVVNRRVDRIMRVVDRQRARYEIADLRRELDDHRTALKRGQDNQAKLDAEHEKALATLDVEAETVSSERAVKHNAAVDAHRISGRRGEFKLVGGDKQADQAFKAALDQIAARRLMLINEHKANRDNIEVQWMRFEEEIAKREARIAECKELIGG